MSSFGDDANDDFESLIEGASNNNIGNYTAPLLKTQSQSQYLNNKSSSYPRSAAVSSTINVDLPQPVHNARDVTVQRDANLRTYATHLQTHIPTTQPVRATDVMQDNRFMVENYKHAHEYSSDLAETYEKFYVPIHCNRLTYASQYVEINVTDTSIVQLDSKAFLSRTDYEQGDNSLPIIADGSDPKGNLANAFLISLGLTNVTNNCDFPIAVIIG